MIVENSGMRRFGYTYIHYRDDQLITACNSIPFGIDGTTWTGIWNSFDHLSS